MTTAPGRSARADRSRWLLALALALGIAVGAVVAVVALNRGDDDPGGSSVSQLTRVQASCGDWMSTSQGDTGADGQWCADMFAWMSRESSGSMMDSMMWQGPDEMGAACRDWVIQHRAETGASGQQRCDDMVAWMDQDMSSRGGNWMMQDR